jgi:hypothetical protein
MTEISPNLLLPYIMPSQAQKHVTHNEAVRALDALTQIAVVDRDRMAPPADPFDGDRYIVPAGATEAWSNKTGQIAAWQDGAWAFYMPGEGWLAWVIDEGRLLVHRGSEWLDLPGSGSGGGGGGNGGSGDIAGVISHLINAAGLIYRNDPSAVAGAGGYKLSTYYQAAAWTNGPASEPSYIDDVWASGINMAGVGLRADNSRQYAAWHLESKFYSNPQQSSPWTENFLHVVDRHGGVRRPIGWVGAHDGSYGNVTLAQSLLLLQGHNHQPKIDLNFETNAAMVYDGLVTTYLANNVPPHRQRNAANGSTIALPYVDDADNLVLGRPLTQALNAGSKNASGLRSRTRGFNTDAFYAEAPGGLAATFALSCGVTQAVSAAISVTANGTTTVMAAAGAVEESQIGRTITGANVPANTRITDVIDATTFKTSNALPASVTSIAMSARTKRSVEYSVDNAGVVTFDYSGSYIFRDKNASYGFGLHIYQGNVGIGAGAAYPSGAKLVVDGPVRLKTYALAALPSASAAGAGALIYVSDAAAGQTLACSDGAAWKVLAALGATVS